MKKLKKILNRIGKAFKFMLSTKTFWFIFSTMCVVGIIGIILGNPIWYETYVAGSISIIAGIFLMSLGIVLIGYVYIFKPIVWLIKKIKK